jgi:cell division protein FtsX
MSFSPSRSIGRGIRNSLSRSGVAVFVPVLLAQAAVLIAFNTVLQSTLQEELHGLSIGLTLPVGDAVAGTVGLAGALFGVVATVGGMRALTRERAALNDLPSSLVTRRLGWAALSLLGSGVVVWVLVTVGFLLVIPGLFFAVSFLFVPYLVCVEDERAFTALRRSWRLSSGNRWGLFALMLAATVALGVVNAGIGVLSLIDLAAAQAVSLVVISAFNVVSITVVGDAFRQLRGGASP